MIALVETAAGVFAASAVCAVSGVVRPAFGNVDLAAELGVEHDDDHAALAHTRQLPGLATAAAGAAPPIDGV